MQTVLLLFGGRSAEHEISILSAKFVLRSLDPARFAPLLCGIDKRGRWHRLREDQLPASDDPRQVSVDDRAPVANITTVDDDEPTPPLQLVDRAGASHPFDVVFPVLHGPYGEDGALQGMLEMHGIPYVGSGVTASALGMDKRQQKRVFERLGLPVAPHVAFDRAAFSADSRGRLEACAALGLPLFVKPANMGSSLGISKVAAASGLSAAVALAFEYDEVVLVEKGLPAAREIEVAVLGNDDPQATDPGEIAVRHADGFYSYAAKYLDPHGAELRVPAELPPAERDAAKRLALAAYRALGCAGLARVDAFVSQGKLFLNEVNTMPGFTAISMFPLLWRHAGLTDRALVTRLIDLAFERHARRAKLRVSR